jgi:hypothetical protein
LILESFCDVELGCLMFSRKTAAIAKEMLDIADW